MEQRYNNSMESKPDLKIIGEDGNAFNILGLARRAATKAKWPADKIDKYLEEAMSGDYSHLLAITAKYFNVK
jgi:hypothetical protein